MTVPAPAATPPRLFVPAFPCSELCQEGRTKVSSKGHISSPPCVSPGCCSDGVAAPVLREPWTPPDPPLIFQSLRWPQIRARWQHSRSFHVRLTANTTYSSSSRERDQARCSLDCLFRAHRDTGVEILSITSAPTQVCAARFIIQRQQPCRFKLLSQSYILLGR